VRWLARLAAVAALTSSVIQFGFKIDPSTVLVLNAFILLGASVVMFWRLRQLARPEERRSKQVSTFECASAAVLLGWWLVVIGVFGPSGWRYENLFFTKLFLVVQLLCELARAMERVTRAGVRAAVLMFASFVFMIAIGTVLLLLPEARKTPWSFVDALFTSTSAACVTGLSTHDIGTELSLKGQAVLLVLMQLGGLGPITFFMLVAHAQRRRLDLKELAMVRDVLCAPSLANLGQRLAYIAGITFGVELLGAALLIGARSDLAAAERVWWGVFHSVSAFCNAGFGLSANSFIGLGDNGLVIGTLSGLIVLGGIGFPVMTELLRHNFSLFRLRHLMSKVRKRLHLLRACDADAATAPASRLSLQTKLTLITSLLLLVGGTILFCLSEIGGVLKNTTPAHAFWISLFQAVSARTAGFSSVDIAALRPSTLLLIMVLMSIGASPASTGGGVKTTTVAIVGLTIQGLIRGNGRVEAFGRSIPASSVSTCVTIAAFYTLAVSGFTLLLLITEQSSAPHFIALLFESISALTTTGLSTGITPTLTEPGKVALCAAMLLGRLGPLTIVWAVLVRPRFMQYEYPEEKLIIS
jgi:Trk-type K+ transport system membrane component